MDFIDAIITGLFIPLWPLGIALPIIATIILFYKKRRDLIVLVPVVSTAIWFIARVVLMWDILIGIIFPEHRISNPIGINLETLILTGIIGLALVVLTLSALSTWVTHMVLKKISGHKQ